MTITATSDNQILKSNIRNWAIGLQTFANAPSYGYAYAPGAYYGGYATPYYGYAYAPRLCTPLLPLLT
jgi:hypothetical protein